MAVRMVRRLLRSSSSLFRFVISWADGRISEASTERIATVTTSSMRLTPFLSISFIIIVVSRPILLFYLNHGIEGNGFLHLPFLVGKIDPKETEAGGPLIASLERRGHERATTVDA